MTGTCIGSTFITDQTKFIEHLQTCKQFGKILDIKNMQKRPQAQKPIFLVLESEKSENVVPKFENFGKYIKDAPKKTMQNGYTLLQTSSWGSEMKQHRSGVKLKNTVKM